MLKVGEALHDGRGGREPVVVELDTEPNDVEDERGDGAVLDVVLALNDNVDGLGEDTEGGKRRETARENRERKRKK